MSLVNPTTEREQTNYYKWLCLQSNTLDNQDLKFTELSGFCIKCMQENNIDIKDSYCQFCEYN